MTLKLIHSNPQVKNCKLRERFGETIGDIPLLSRNLIATRLLSQKGPGMSKEIISTFIQKLFLDMGNGDQMTPNQVIEAVDLTCIMFKEHIYQIQDLFPEEKVKKQIYEEALKVIEDSCVILKLWLANNINGICCNVDKMPWQVVKALRDNFSLLLHNEKNLFATDIDEGILAIASERGIQATSAENAWRRMSM